MEKTLKSDMLTILEALDFDEFVQFLVRKNSEPQKLSNSHNLGSRIIQTAEKMRSGSNYLFLIDFD